MAPATTAVMTVEMPLRAIFDLSEKARDLGQDKLSLTRIGMKNVH
jgi:hypothetical protein